MRGNESLPSGDTWAHRIKTGDGGRLRDLYNEFNAKKIANLLDGDKSVSTSASTSASTSTSTSTTGTASDTPTDSHGSSSGNTGSGVASAAPFATGGTPLKQGAASAYGIGLDGKAAAIAVEGGKMGVAGTGDANTVDHHGATSEAIGFVFDAGADEITFKLAGLSSKNGASEAAKLTVYDGDGDVLDTLMFSRNGSHSVDLGDGAEYAKLEAADWVSASGNHPSGEPDFALVSFHLDYV